jgi:acyl-CoA thioester hydrolase
MHAKPKSATPSPRTPHAADADADADTVFRHTLRVYWEDTDAGGVVFYANYLKFFERARTEWLRALGFSQQHMLQQDGVMFVVAETALRYLRAARLDDTLDITVQVLDHGRASLRIAQQAWRGDELLAEGDIRIGCVSAAAGQDFRPCRIPAAIQDRIS